LPAILVDEYNAFRAGASAALCSFFIALRDVEPLTCDIAIFVKRKEVLSDSEAAGVSDALRFFNSDFHRSTLLMRITSRILPILRRVSRGSAGDQPSLFEIVPTIRPPA
jgi:hypothetical protein